MTLGNYLAFFFPSSLHGIDNNHPHTLRAHILTPPPTQNVSAFKCCLWLGQHSVRCTVISFWIDLCHLHSQHVSENRKAALPAHSDQWPSVSAWPFLLAVNVPWPDNIANMDSVTVQLIATCSLSQKSSCLIEGEGWKKLSEYASYSNSGCHQPAVWFKEWFLPGKTLSPWLLSDWRVSYCLEAKPTLIYKTRHVDSWVCAHPNFRALLEATDEQYVGMSKFSRAKWRGP